jgi:hypothetical protein
MMTPEKQRIAIAEACGWVFEKKPRYNKMSKIPAWHLITPEGKVRCYKEYTIYTTRGIDTSGYAFEGELVDYIEEASVPDYLNDLNAMHEAEKVLIRPNLYAKGGWGTYLRHLSIVTDEQHPIDATAAQRAEAFLRAVGKWEGE